MIADSQSIGYDRKRRIDRATGDEEAAVDNVQVVKLMRFAILIERACPRIISDPHGADLMRYPREGDSLADEEIARE